MDETTVKGGVSETQMSSSNADSCCFKFETKEKVLCFHQGFIYEGRIIKQIPAENGEEKRYLMHYNGWSKKWDEEVDETRVLKITEENLSLQKQLIRSTSAAESIVPSKKKGNKSVSRKSVDTNKDENSSTSIVSGAESNSVNASNLDSTKSTSTRILTQKKLLQNVESEARYLAKPALKIDIPDVLKQVLMKDYDLIIRQKKILIVPGRCSVFQVLKQYIESIPAEMEEKMGAIIPFVDGIQDYFLFLLGSQLLYAEERQQFNQIRENWLDNGKTEEEFGLALVHIFGPIHLTRLFTRLGQVLSFSTVERDYYSFLQFYIKHFLKFICENEKYFFKFDEDYQVNSSTISVK